MPRRNDRLSATIKASRRNADTVRRSRQKAVYTDSLAELYTAQSLKAKLAQEDEAPLSPGETGTSLHVTSHHQVALAPHRPGQERPAMIATPDCHVNVGKRKSSEQSAPLK